MGSFLNKVLRPGFRKKQANPLMHPLSRVRAHLKTPAFCASVGTPTHVSAYVIHRTDHHLNEQIPPAGEHMKWLTGFSGSAGLLIITARHAGLFVDGRYITQAPQEVHPGVNVYPWSWDNITAFINAHLGADETVCVEGTTLSARAAKTWQKQLPNPVTFSEGLIDTLWDNRPAWPSREIFTLTNAFTGQDTTEKITNIQQFIAHKNADALLLTDMCAISWLFNIRGSDLGNTPVAYCYAWVPATGKPCLFLANPHDCGGTIVVHAYKDLKAFITSQKKTTLLADESETPQHLWEHINKHHTVKSVINPIQVWKAQKNPTQIQGFRDCHRGDAIALCETFSWIEATHTASQPLTELSIEQYMNAQRLKQAHTLGLSFDPIVGWNDHGAIIHYRATRQTDHTISGSGLLLIDSGGQYKNGTTDVTRTLCLGTPTPAQVHDYTHVLKGMIQLSMATFAPGTSGQILDARARNQVKNAGTDYAHGTGHGVGHCLNVHEGPFSISPRPQEKENDTGILPGMVLSNEPGIYRVGNYGIRIENLMVVVTNKGAPTDQNLTFETLTMVPLAPQLIDTDLLTTEEITWINTYNASIKSHLSAALSHGATQWLLRVCAPL